MTPNDVLSWKRATALAAGWVAALTAVGVAASLLVDGFYARNSMNPFAGQCYLALGPLLLLMCLVAPTLARRVHRSSRVETLVGAFIIVELLLGVLVWISLIIWIVRNGP
jgi:hypothetical protein